MIWTPYDHPATYSTNSIKRLASCAAPIQQVFNDLAIEGWDISIFCGVRSEVDQTKAYEAGLSGTPWPKSDHNAVPPDLSNAIDAGPFVPGIGIPWNITSLWVYFAGVVLLKAEELGYTFEWGGFYSNVKDLNHFSLK